MKTGESYSYLAEAAIAAYALVKFGANDGGILTAAASTDLIIGGIGKIPAAAGDRVDIVRDDFIEVQLGGTATRGQKLTSDGAGKAVAAAPGAGVNAQIIGVAESSGVAGDIIWVYVSVSVMQG